MKKNKIFYNKFLIILSVALLAVFVFTSSVFATDEFSFVDTNNNTIVVSFLPDSCNINSSNGWLYKNTNGLFFFLDDNSYFYIKSDNKIGVSGTVRICKYQGDGVWDIGSSVEYDVSNAGSYIGVLSEFSYFTAPIYSDINRDSISINTTGNDFFSVSPLVGVMLVEKTEMETIQEILGILPIILVILVSLISLRKGLRVLLTVLHRS